MDQKTVVITGGATGIGLETAKLLLKDEAYRVILIGLNDSHLKNAVSTLGSALSHRITVLACDLSKPEEIKSTAQKIIAEFGMIYGLVNNAGIYPFGGITDTTLESWDMTFTVNLKAPFYLIQCLLPALKKNNEGRIINISSTAGILPNHFALSYSVSKAGLIQLSKTLAKELGPEQITVNCICPGIIKSPMHERYHKNKSELEAFYSKRGTTFPAKRVGTPEDIAGVVEYFLSEKASWVTGEVFIADGGRLLI